MRMDRGGAVLLLVDLQERLVPALHGGDGVVSRAVRCAEAARLLEVPVRATEQNPAGLGPTVAPLRGAADAVLAKTSFSAVADPHWADLLPPQTRQVVVAGCEAHVCVLQTVLDVLDLGLGVAVVADATGSRDPRDRDAAMARAARSGADVVTSEMVLFEWLGDAAHPRFREVQKLLR
ncbi:MAG TPA: isochorismatase family protein [Dermatophilaceae bacterium]|nr:isochorismatase family protein [Dermatophilaceae bacterium]